MAMLKRIFAFLMLVLFWWLGTIISPLLPIPFPAPLIGLVLLFCALLVIGRVPESGLHVSQFLLKHLSVFFVPAILSVVLLQDLLMTHFWAIAGALLVSTVLSLVATAYLCQKLKAHNG